MSLGTDLAWVDGDLTDDLAAEDDGAAAYIGRIQRALTTNGLWHRPTWGRDVRAYIEDTPDDRTIELEVQAVVDSDPETFRSEVRVARSGEKVNGTIRAYTKRGRTVDLTLAIDALTVEILTS